MKSRFLVLFICLLATAIVGCNLFGSDDDDNVVGTTYGNLKVNVTADTGIPVPSFKVANAAVTAENQGGGSYLINNIAVGEKVRLDVEAAGYLTGYAFEPITAGNTTVTNISLVSSANAALQTANSLKSAQDTLVFNFGGSNVSIIFPQNSIVNAAGDPVDTAEVKVIYKAPAATSTLDTFPGVFAGVPTDATTPIPFETFGFVNIDLGANELDPDIGASLTIPLGANNPTTGDYSLEMPLWRFDTTDGVWKQVATATRTLTTEPFSAHVKTFSWYNLDAPVTVDKLVVVVSSYTSELNEWAILESGTKDPDRDDLTKRVNGVTVVVSATSGTISGEGWQATQGWENDTYTWQDKKVTDSTGIANFNIPKDRTFSINVTAPDGTVKSGYMFEVVNGVATAYINFGKFTGEFDQGGIVTPENEN